MKFIRVRIRINKINDESLTAIDEGRSASLCLNNWVKISQINLTSRIYVALERREAREPLTLDDPKNTSSKQRCCTPQ